MCSVAKHVSLIKVGHKIQVRLEDQTMNFVLELPKIKWGDEAGCRISVYGDKMFFKDDALHYLRRLQM